MIKSLLNPKVVGEIIFILFIIVTILGALIAVLSRRMTRAVLGLALCMLGTAVFYLYLNSPFVSVMQLLIYVGAICVTIAFAVMLAEPPKVPIIKSRSLFHLLIIPVAGLLPGVCLIYFLFRTPWIPSKERVLDFSVASIGKSLLLNYCLVFEVISLILFVAIIGSVIVARIGRIK